MRTKCRAFIRVAWTPLVVILLVSGASAEGLGRLFSTPQERDRLDTLRRTGEQRALSGSETRVDSPLLTSRLTVNGLVMRERGPDSVWINGERVSRGRSTREGIRAQGKAGARVHVILPHDAGSVLLKAGQKVDLTTGSIRDAYEPDLDALPASRPLPGTRTDISRD